MKSPRCGPNPLRHTPGSKFRFVWAEGRFDGGGLATYAVNASAASFASLRNIYATGAGVGPNHSGVFLQDLMSSRITHLTAVNNGGPSREGVGIRMMKASSGNVLHSLMVAENARHGFHIDSALGDEQRRIQWWQRNSRVQRA